MESMDTPALQLPNPLTPMAWLPPDLAFQVTISIYIYVGTSAVMIWDVINNLKADYLMLTKYRIGFPTIVYVISRFGTVAYILSATIYETAPAGNCAVFEKVVDSFYPLAVSSTSLLFFFRVRAIFDQNKAVIAFFAFLWLTVLAGCLTVTQGIAGGEIGTTEYCLNIGLKGYVAAAAIIPLVHDTLVFLAITWRLMMNSHRDYSFKDGVRTLVFGEYMPALSRALLQDGQVYYMTTVSTNLLTVIMLYVSSVPVTYRTMFPAPNVMLMNIMACRVFRNTKFGIFRETMLSTTQLKSQLKARSTAVIPLAFIGNSRNQGSASAEMVVDKKGTEVMKTVQGLSGYNHSDDIVDNDSV